MDRTFAEARTWAATHPTVRTATGGPDAWADRLIREYADQAEDRVLGLHLRLSAHESYDVSPPRVCAPRRA